MTKKSKKPTKKQRKRQRRAAMARVRRERGWTPPPAHEPPADDEFYDLPRPFPGMADGSEGADPILDQFLAYIMGSEDLADEPEFEEVFVPPTLFADTYLQVAQESEVASQPLDELPEEESQEVQMGLLDETARRLLTDELRQEILAGLDRLRSRLEQAGQIEQFVKAAAVHGFLTQFDSSEVWAMVGLVRAIIGRSFVTGFEMAAAAEEIQAAWEAEESAGEDQLSILRMVTQGRPGQQAEALLQKFPGLSRFLEKEADRVWEEGMDALFDGELYLGLFLPDELARGAELFIAAFRPEGDLEEMAAGGEPLPLQKERVERLFSQLDEYLAELLTAERIEQMRARLDALLTERPFEDRWFQFIMMIAQDMAEEEPLEYARPFLIRALLGELRMQSASPEEEEEEVEEATDAGSEGES